MKAYAAHMSTLLIIGAVVIVSVARPANLLL